MVLGFTRKTWEKDIYTVRREGTRERRNDRLEGEEKESKN